MSVDTPIVDCTSIDIQFTFSSLLKFFLGGTILVIYALLSLMNASGLKPSDSKAVCPKFELEFVSDISPPDSVTNCFAYPTAKHDTI